MRPPNSLAVDLLVDQKLRQSQTHPVRGTSCGCGLRILPLVVPCMDEPHSCAQKGALTCLHAESQPSGGGCLPRQGACGAQGHSSKVGKPQYIRAEERLCTAGRRCVLKEGEPHMLSMAAPSRPSAARDPKQGHQALSCTVSAVVYACIRQGYWSCLAQSSIGHSCRTGSAGMAGCVLCHLPSRAA